MRLGAEVKSLDAIPEDWRENYEPVTTEDGGTVYRLAVLNGYESQDAVKGLKSALKKERDNVSLLKKEITTLKGAQPTESDDLRSQLAAKDKELANSAAQAAALSALQKAGADADLLLPLVTKRLRAEKNGNGGGHTVEVLGEDGNPLLSESGEPLSVGAFVESLKAKHPNAFAGTPHRGGGAPADGGTGRYSASSTSKRRSKMTPKEKVAFIREHGNAKFMELPW
jgi:hypothetical protein